MDRRGAAHAATKPFADRTDLKLLMGILLLLLVALCGPAIAQSSDVPDNKVPKTETAENNNQYPTEGTSVQTGREDLPTGYITYKTPYEYYLVIVTVGTLLVILIALVAISWRTGLTPHFSRTFTIVVVVFAALFLIAAGYSDKQAAPVYALLGSIVGYLFGRMKDEPAQDDPEKPAPRTSGTPDKDTIQPAPASIPPKPATRTQEGEQ